MSDDERISREPISRETVAKVSRLARLALTDDEIDETTAQLAKMLDHFADIDALEARDDWADVEPMTQPYPLRNVFRDDVEQAVLDRGEVLAQAPKAVEGRFEVPPIIGLEES